MKEVVLGVTTMGVFGVLSWMAFTLITVDKRTEVMDVKIDHLVQSVEELSERKFSLDKSWTNIIPSIQVTSETN